MNCCTTVLGVGPFCFIGNVPVVGSRMGHEVRSTRRGFLNADYKRSCM